MSRRLLRFDLATALLALAAAGAWLAYFANRARFEELDQDNRQLATLAEEVYFIDPGRSAVIPRTTAAGTDREWEIYLAPGSDYQWQIATQDIPSDGVTESQSQNSVSPGRHRILVRQLRAKDGTELTTRLFVDRQLVFESTDELDAPVTQQMQILAALARGAAQAPLDLGSKHPLIAHRWYVQTPDVNGGTLREFCPGLVLWITTQ